MSEGGSTVRAVSPAAPAGLQPADALRPGVSWLLVLLVVVAAAVLRVRLLDVPLVRDEGEYAYAGQLLLQGVPPYTLAYNMKLPGTYVAYALIIAALGESDRAIHLGLLLVNAATTVGLFLLARRCAGAPAGVIAAACFALLSLGRPVHGLFANIEHFVLLPAVCGLVVLLGALHTRRWPALLGSGLLLGLAYVMKQHGAAFTLLGGVYLLAALLRARPLRLGAATGRLAAFSLAAALPFALVCLWMWLTGVFGQFWFWTVDYAREYVSESSLSGGLRNLRGTGLSVVQAAPALWALAAAGVLTTLVRWRRLSRPGFGLLFLLLSLLAITPGFYFRRDYFVLLLPAVSLFAGVGAVGAAALLARRAPLAGKPPVAPTALALASLALALSLWQQRDYLFESDPEWVARMTYPGLPLAEAREVGRFLREHAHPGDRLAVLGSEPHLYFYSGLRSATGYIYMYPLMERQRYARQMQVGLIAQVQAAEPRYIVYVENPSSWLRRSSSEDLIFRWWRPYRDRHYRRVGVADMVAWRQSNYRWGEQASEYQVQGRAWLEVFERVEQAAE